MEFAADEDGSEDEEPNGIYIQYHEPRAQVGVLTDGQTDAAIA